MLLDLCDFLLTKGHRPVLLHFPHPWLERECQKRGIEHHVLRYQKLFKKIYLLPLFAFQMRKTLKDLDVDILHSHLFGPIVGGAIASKIALVPHIGTLHDTYMIEEKPSRIYQVKLAARLGTKLVAVSHHMQRFYQMRLNNEKHELDCIFNGIQIPIQSISRGNSHVNFICVGRLIPLKQVELITQAFINLSKEINNISLTIVGDGDIEIRTRLQRMVASQALDNIKLVGNTDKVSHYLSEANIFIQYSTTEGLSRSIIEATAHGLPCIVSDVGGNNEIVRNQLNGILVDEKDLTTLQQAMKELAENEDMRSSFAQNSYEHARKAFSSDATNAAYLNHYINLKNCMSRKND